MQPSAPDAEVVARWQLRIATYKRRRNLAPPTA
jgi:hypothetical protein